MEIKEAMREIIEVDKSILLQRDEFLSALENVSSSPKDFQAVRRAVNSTNICEMFFLSDGKSLKEKENIINAVDGKLYEIGTQEARIDFVIDAFIYALNWDVKRTKRADKSKIKPKDEYTLYLENQNKKLETRLNDTINELNKLKKEYDELKKKYDELEKKSKEGGSQKVLSAVTNSLNRNFNTVKQGYNEIREELKKGESGAYGGTFQKVLSVFNGNNNSKKNNENAPIATEFLNEYNSYGNQTDNYESWKFRKNLVSKYALKAFSCANLSERMQNRSLPPIYEDASPLMAHIWAYPLGDDKFAAVPRLSQYYDDVLHNAGALSMIFESNFVAGETYDIITVARPAVFQNAGGDWKLMQKGEIRLK